MTLHARKHLTAWLGLVAMWLIVLAPLVSQLVVAHRGQLPEAPLCSAALPATGSHHDVQDGGLVACGYCALLATHAAMPPVAGISLLMLALIALAAVGAWFVHFIPARVFPAGRPRAPPAPC